MQLIINNVVFPNCDDTNNIVFISELIQVLVIDGKMQSAEVDEFIYHECLIHPALLCHPKSVLLSIYSSLLPVFFFLSIHANRYKEIGNSNDNRATNSLLRHYIL